MKTLTEIWRVLLWTIVIGTVLYFLFRPDPPEPKPEPEKVVERDTLYIKADTVYVHVYHQLPGKDSIIHDTIPTHIDTAAILADYYSKSFYSDTISDDTTYSIVVNDIISQNKITSRDAYYKRLRPEVITTIIRRPDPENKFYIGADLMYTKSTFLYMTGTYISKTDKIYTLGIDPISKGLKIGFATNIKTIRK